MAVADLQRLPTSATCERETLLQCGTRLSRIAFATGKRPLGERRMLDLARLGALAADCLARAIARGVFEATGWSGVTCWRDLT